YRDIAQRILTERGSSAEVREKLEKVVLDSKASRKGRLHSLWALIGSGDLTRAFHEDLLKHEDPTIRAWAVRAAGNAGKVDLFKSIRLKMLGVEETSRDVLLQLAIAASKLKGVDPIPTLINVLSRCGDDKLIPHIVWQNLHPLLEEKGGELVALLHKR